MPGLSISAGVCTCVLTMAGNHSCSGGIANCAAFFSRGFMSSMLVSHTVPRGAYPERQEARPGRFDALWLRASGLLSRQVQVRRLRLRQFVQEVNAHSQAYDALGPSAIRAMADELRYRLRCDGRHTDLVARTFALVRTVATQTLSMQHFDVQV